MTPELLAVGALLAGVAAAGVLWPFIAAPAAAATRGGSEDGGASARAARSEDEARALRLAAILSATFIIAAAAVAGVTAGDVAPPPAAPAAEDPTAMLEAAVRANPGDLTARLDLAEAYLAEGDVSGALDQYLEAVRIDPRAPEAHARLGALLYRSGRPEEGLAAVDRALEIEPSFPEALYLRGIILLRGLDRQRPAAEAFRTYLDAAPFGAHRDEVQALLAELDA